MGLLPRWCYWSNVLSPGLKRGNVNFQLIVFARQCTIHSTLKKILAIRTIYKPLFFLHFRNEPILLKFRVRENLSGAFVGQLIPKATNTSVDPAIASKLRNFKFTIANQAEVKDMFAISQDGTLYTHKGLDREVRDAYMLTIVAENTRGLRGGGLFQVRRKYF